MPQENQPGRIQMDAQIPGDVTVHTDEAGNLAAVTADITLKLNDPSAEKRAINMTNAEIGDAMLGQLQASAISSLKQLAAGELDGVTIGGKEFKPADVADPTKIDSLARSAVLQMAATATTFPVSSDGYGDALADNDTRVALFMAHRDGDPDYSERAQQLVFKAEFYVLTSLRAVANGSLPSLTAGQTFTKDDIPQESIFPTLAQEMVKEVVGKSVPGTFPTIFTRPDGGVEIRPTVAGVMSKLIADSRQAAATLLTDRGEAKIVGVSPDLKLGTSSLDREHAATGFDQYRHERDMLAYANFKSKSHGLSSEGDGAKPAYHLPMIEFFGRYVDHRRIVGVEPYRFTDYTATPKTNHWGVRMRYKDGGHDSDTTQIIEEWEHFLHSDVKASEAMARVAAEGFMHRLGVKHLEWKNMEAGLAQGGFTQRDVITIKHQDGNLFKTLAIDTNSINQFVIKCGEGDKIEEIEITLNGVTRFYGPELDDLVTDVNRVVISDMAALDRLAQLLCSTHKPMN